MRSMFALRRLASAVLVDKHICNQVKAEHIDKEYRSLLQFAIVSVYVNLNCRYI